MNTTLDLDADVLEAAKEISARTQRTTGQVISDLVRLALAITPSPAAQPVAPDRLYLAHQGRFPVD